MLAHRGRQVTPRLECGLERFDHALERDVDGRLGQAVERTQDGHSGAHEGVELTREQLHVDGLDHRREQRERRTAGAAPLGAVALGDADRCDAAPDEIARAGDGAFTVEHPAHGVTAWCPSGIDELRHQPASSWALTRIASASEVAPARASASA